MTANKRIAVNMLATYGRSLYTLVLGLFTARWVLAALGKVDYGLIGLVGGLVGFITFFNQLLSVSTGRYFAYSVGQQSVEGGEDYGLRECQAWFTTAVVIHFVLGTVLVIVGYPIGLWAVNHFLNIPVARVESCETVWLVTCITCFINMINVPYRAMYYAKQEIAEMTGYAIFTATANAAFLYYAASHPRDWMVPYSIVVAVLSLGPLLVMCIRACCKYPECRLVREGLLDIKRMKAMFGYSVAQFLADFAVLVRGQGSAILVNKYLGPAFNAAMEIGSRVASQALTLGSAMIGAISPAVVNAAGAKQFDRMRLLSYQACKLGSAFVLFFAVPLMLEIDEVLILWLKDPPDGAAILCAFSLAYFIIDRVSSGLSSSIEALGKIAAFKSCMGIVGLLPLPLGWLFLEMGMGVFGVALAELVIVIPFTMARLYFSRKLAGISVRYWFVKIFCPVMMVWLIGAACALVPRLQMAPSFLRVVITTCVSEIVLLPLVWLLVFTKNERTFVANRIRSMFHA